MKLNPDEIKNVKDEYRKPDLGEVITTSAAEEPVNVSPRAEQASAAPSTAIADSVAASGEETTDALSSMMEQNSQLNAKLLVALDDISRGNFAVQESLDRMFRFMWDERYAPKPTIVQRAPFVPDSKSKEDRPGDGTGSGEGALDGLLGGLLGAAGAALAGKSILGSVFGRNRGAATTTQPRSRIGGWVDRIRGKTATNTPNSPDLPNNAARTASTTASPAPSPNRTPTTPNTPTSTPDSTGRTMPKGGKMALIAGVGTAAYMGYDWVSSKISESSKRMDENRFITLEERTLQSNRVSAGLPMLEGQDLINYRTEMYGRNNILVNPKTGFPLSQAQADAVRNGASPEYASSLTNEQSYELISSSSVTAPPAESNSSTSSLIPSYADELALTGVGIYAAKKVGDMVSPTTVAPSTAPNAVVPSTAPTSVSRTAPPLLSRPPMVDNVRRQALPNDAQLKAIRTNITNTASSVVDTVEAPKMKMGKALPLIGTALTVYDAANVITDDTKTTGEKAGELTDIAGGTAGAILGAKAGAGAGAAVGAAIGAFFFGAGAVPGAAIGAAIGGIGGGIAGYMGGSSVTKSAREWMFGDEDPETTTPNPTPVVASSTTSVGDSTEEAFNQIVNASKPINNSWISSVSPSTSSNPVGVGVMRPGVANPNVSNPKTTSSTANVASSAGVFAQAASATPSASISSVTTNPVPVVREAYQPVKETYVVNNTSKESSTTVAATASKERVANRGMGSSNTATTRIDEISPVINDGGLGLLNAGVL
jgi:hypothetical protein